MIYQINYHSQYFKWNKPKAIILRRSNGLKYTNILVEEGLVDGEIDKVKDIALKGIVGYRNYD